MAIRLPAAARVRLAIVAAAFVDFTNLVRQAQSDNGR
jgi:hypothetical protein